MPYPAAPVDSAVVAFVVVFVAELGDKSQLMTLTFATRFRPSQVLVGIVIAIAIMNGLSVLAGGLVGSVLPPGPVAIVAGLVFYGFAAWTLRESGHQEEAAQTARFGAPIVAVAVTFLLAEFGDKTMLATATLASTRGWAAVWLGSTLGMVGANVLAVAVGRQLRGRISERTVRIGAAVAFVIFGTWLLIDGFLQL